MRKIALWAEGPDDRRFLEWVIKPRLEQQFAAVKILEYSTRVREVSKLLQSMSHQGFEYLFTADQDSNPCISSRREKLLGKLPILDSKRIIIVGREIEAWYIAGLKEDSARELEIKPYLRDCETKEEFLKMVTGRFASPLDLKIELLKAFDYQEACSRSHLLPILIPS